MARILKPFVTTGGLLSFWRDEDRRVESFSMPERKSPTILVADADRLMRWALAERLSEEGYVVWEAVEPETALAFVRRVPDIAILDAGLLTSSGDDLSAALIAFARDHSLILITSDRTTIPMTFVKATTSSVLEKPLRLDAVADLVAKARRSVGPR